MYYKQQTCNELLSSTCSSLDLIGLRFHFNTGHVAYQLRFINVDKYSIENRTKRRQSRLIFVAKSRGSTLDDKHGVLGLPMFVIPGHVLDIVYMG